MAFIKYAAFSRKFRALFIISLIVHSSVQEQLKWLRSLENNYTVHQRSKREPAGCNIVIHELNIDNPGATKSQFIELVKKCHQAGTPKDGSDSLDGYIAILIRGSPPSLVAMFDLTMHKMTKVQNMGQVLVMGEDNVNVKWKVPFGHNTFQSIYRDQRLPVGDDSPYGFAVLYASPKSLLRDVRLHRVGQEFVPRDVNSIINFGNLMRRHLVDMVVYGRKVWTNRCYIFEKILKGPEYLQYLDENSYKGDPYMLRDFDSSTGPDLSLSRCSSDLSAFVPMRFRLGKPSPGAENDCSGTSFFLEDHLQQIILSPTRLGQVEMMEGCEPDSPGVTAEDYRDLTEDQYHHLVRTQQGRATQNCGEDNFRDLGTASDRARMFGNIRAIEQYGHELRYPLTRQHTFNPLWEDQCKNDLPFFGRLLKDEGIRSWLDVTLDAGHCRFSCATCKKYFDSGFKPDYRKRTQMMSPRGYWNKEKSENKIAIENHVKSELHQEATRVVARMMAVSSESQLSQVISAEENRLTEELQETINLIRLVYAETRADVSFAKHTLIWRTVKNMGARLGTHHFHEKAPSQVTEIISDEMHANLVRHLLSSNVPFALIVDSSTANTNDMYLICYIQTLEDEFPMVYFYGLLYLDQGEDAEKMFNAFQRKVDDDERKFPGFKNIVLRNLKVLASDGANVMKGEKNSFYSKLRTYVGGTLSLIWCFAHKIDLSVKKGLLKSTDPDFSIFRSFEGITNQFYTFYMSRGCKNWIHLGNIAKDLDLGLGRIKYYFNTRWSSGHYGAMMAVKKDYKALLIDLTAIGAVDSDFTKETKIKAQDLHDLLEDKLFAFLINEYLDFLYIYKQISEAFQESEGLLVSKAKIIDRAIAQLRSLKNDPGKNVKSFLLTCHCVNVCELGKCTVNSYFLCPYPVCDGMAFRASKFTVNYTNLRPKMYESLIAALSEYFDLNLLRSFEIFSPSALSPSNLAVSVTNRPASEYCDAVSNSLSDWNSICNFFFKTLSSGKTECIESFSAWNQLVKSIQEKSDIMTNIREPVASFWFQVKQTPGIKWTPFLQRLIQLVLITPFSSADCERGFSIMNTVKRDSRSSMTPKTLDRLLRLKINGPSDPDRLRADQYAKAFVKVHLPSNTREGITGRRRNPLKEKSFFKYSRLF